MLLRSAHPHLLGNVLGATDFIADLLHRGSASCRWCDVPPSAPGAPGQTLLVWCHLLDSTFYVK